MRSSIVKSALLLAIAFAGCKKESLNNSTTAALDNGIAENYYNDMYSVVTSAAADNNFAGFTSSNSGSKTSSDCPTVTFSAPMGIFPNTMTIDFGEGCIGYFGVERSGKIIATFSGPYADAGTVITITTDNYYINGNKVEGNKTVTNMGLNDAGNMYFNIVVTEGHIYLADGSDFTWESTRSREWIEGSSTFAIDDDVYLITGNADGINRGDIPFTMNITEALRKEMDCKWVVSGKMEITPEGLETRKIDFGGGECDNVITVTIGDFTTTIELPY